MTAFVGRTSIIYLLGNTRERLATGETWYGFTSCYPPVLRGRTASETVEKIMVDVVKGVGLLEVDFEPAPEGE